MPEKAYPLLKGEKRRPGFVTILSPICHQISGGIETPPLPPGNFSLVSEMRKKEKEGKEKGKRKREKRKEKEKIGEPSGAF
jgi:hypothetical protein